MKDLITAVASVLLLMIFVLQFAGNQVTHVRVFQSGLAVESFRDALREDGKATEASIGHLRQELARLCGCSPEEISVEVQDSGGQQTGGREISYEVSFPLENLIVMGSALGIPPEENRAVLTEKGWVAGRNEESDHHDGADSSDDNGTGS